MKQQIGSWRLHLVRSLMLAVLTLSLTCAAAGQAAPNDYQIGLPAHGDFSGSEFENVQINNGNLHIEIPLWGAAGRGLPVGFKLVYDSSGWGFNEHCNPKYDYCVDTVSPNPGSHGVGPCCSSGNHLILTFVSSQSYGVKWSQQSKNCNGPVHLTRSYHMQAPGGTRHHFVPDPVVEPSGYPICGLPSVGTVYADDGSGWILKVDQTTGLPLKAIGRDGTVIPYGANTVEDSNGNEIVNGTDTLGRPFSTSGYYDSNGLFRSLQVVYQDVAIQTHLCWMSGNLPYCNEYSNTWSVPQTITLPNGMTYTFTYDQGSPTHPYYGQPLSVTLPTGGQITWGWDGERDSGPKLVSRQLSGDPQPWTYGSLTVTDPAGNDTVDTCGLYVPPHNPPGSQPTCYITTQKSYQGGTLIKTVQTDYQLTDAILPIHETTTWNQQNLVSRVETDYDAYPGWTFNNVTNNTSASNPVEKREFAYGTGSWGSIVRTTAYGYLHLTNSTYRGLNIVDKLTSTKIYAGFSQSGTLTAQTLNTYDGVSIPAGGDTSGSSAPNHDYTNFPRSYNLRGNLTQVSRGLKVGSNWTWLNTNNTYNDLGEVLTSTDPLSHTTTYDYADSWATISNPQCVTSAHSYGFPTTITDALNHRTKHTYYSCTSLIGSTQDENDIANSRNGTAFTFDLMNRPLSISYPDGGSTSNSYNDTSLPVSVTQTQAVTSSLNRVTTKAFDGLGRLQQTQLKDPDCQGGSGLVKVDYVYGYDTPTNSRFTKVSTPYCNTPGATYGLLATTKYDPLDRVKSVAQTDGGTISNTFSTSNTLYCTTVTDEAGKDRKACSDGLGRLATVYENPSSANYRTDYAYDVLDDLTSVTQQGTGGNYRTRTFTYDSLSRLVCAANPEVTSSTATQAVCPATNTGAYTNGTIQYNYDADGNLLSKVSPAPNQTGTSTATTSYFYDNVHRLTKKTYSGGLTTPTVQSAYDNNALSGCTIAPPTFTQGDVNPIGYRTSMCDGYGGAAGSGASTWTHDELGRVRKDKQTIVGSSNITELFSYAYNLDGSLASILYPSSNTVTFTPNSGSGITAGRPASAVDAANSINYVTSATYAPDGALAGAKYGYTPTFVGITIANTYNKRLQPITLSATAPSQTVLSLGYDFHLANGDNGNVFQIVNYRDTNRTQNFTYDALNRIASAYTTSNLWGNYYVIDAWGNLYQKNPYPNKVDYEPLTQVANTKNQFTGFCYDSAGNLLDQTTPCPQSNHTYTYDDENRLTSTAGVTYTYDGDGQRVETSVGVLYRRDLGGEVLRETDLAGSGLREYVFSNGKRVARLNLPSTVRYFFSDHLGSTDVVTGATGSNIAEESDYYPYGGERVITHTLSFQPYKFNGKERDSESNLDYFGARHYSSALGRFMVPDWAAKPTNVPYAHFGNPQSLNLYSYVQNNPTTTGDPDGHVCEVCDLTIEAIDKVAKPLIESAVGVSTKAGTAVLGTVLGVAAVVLTSTPAASTKELEFEAKAAAGGNGAKDGGNKTTAVSPGPDGMKPGSANPDNAGKPFDQATKDAARSENGNKCVFCGKETTREPGPDQSNIDHSIPKSRGGDNSLDNAQNTCRTCNLDKGTKTTEEYVKDKKPE